MKRYAFVDGNGNINSIIGWNNQRELPSDYPIPDGCISIDIDDDYIDMTYIYDIVNKKFIMNPNPIEESINNTTVQDLQKQIFNLTTLLVQGGAI